MLEAQINQLCFLIDDKKEDQFGHAIWIWQGITTSLLCMALAYGLYYPVSAVLPVQNLIKMVLISFSTNTVHLDIEPEKYRKSLFLQMVPIPPPQKVMLQLNGKRN